jgi:hypothetical protein
MRLLSCVVAGVILSIGLLAMAAESKSLTFTDPAKAGIEYKLQGEYVGDKVGVQVVALGKGTFKAVVFAGGLPGDGWDGKGRLELPGKLDGEKAAFAGEGYKSVATGDAFTGEDGKGGKLELKKTVRHSPTEGAKAPAGAIVIFDGKNTDELDGAKVDASGLLACGPTTKRKFGSFTLHVEFMLPFMPEARGQGRANSGVYTQKRYETQILDSFGLVSKNNDCAAVYTQVAPSLNMCYPPLAWQTYDIEFTQPQWDGEKKVNNARITVKQNGVVVQDNTEIKKKTGAGAPEGPLPGPINFQNHGNPVVFRNIWIVTK